MLSAMEDASGGLVGHTDLMKSFNSAAQLVSKDFAEQLPDAMQYLSKVSGATGEDMGFMIDSLVKGVGRMSPMILDNLGIQVKLEEATARAADMFGVEADTLTDAQIKAGMMNVVLEKLAENTKDMPDVAGTAAAGFAKLGATWQNVKDKAGVALLPLFQGIFDVIMPLIDKALPKLIEFFEDVSSKAAILGEAIGALISGDMAGFEDALRELFPAEFVDFLMEIPGHFDAFKTKVTEVITVISTALEPVIAFIQEHVNMQDVLIALALILASVVIPAIWSLVAAIGAFLLPILLVIAAVAALRYAWENNLGGIQEKVAVFVAWIQEKFALLKEWWAENGDEIMAKAKEIWDGILAVITAIVDFIVAVVSNYINTIKAFWEEHGAAILALAGAIWDGIKDVIQIAIDAITGIWEAFQLAREGDWYGFGEKLREVWDNLWAAIVEALEATWEFLKTLFGNIWSSIVSSVSDIDWGQLGTDIIQGIIDGVNSMISSLITTVTNAASAAYDAIKGFFASDSPSKLMMELGKNIMIGMGQGIDMAKGFPAEQMTVASQGVFGAAVAGAQSYSNNVTLNIDKVSSDIDLNNMADLLIERLRYVRR